MSTYAWATSRKAVEYYLDRVDRGYPELWEAVRSGLIRARVTDVDFPVPYIAVILDLLVRDVPQAERDYVLPTWIAVNVDDVERVLCGAQTPVSRRGRPKKMGDVKQRDYAFAVSIARLITSGHASTVADASRQIIQTSDVPGHSDTAKMKRLQRAYSAWFRTD